MGVLKKCHPESAAAERIFGFLDFRKFNKIEVLRCAQNDVAGFFNTSAVRIYSLAQASLGVPKMQDL